MDLLGTIIRLDFTADGFSNFRFVNAYFPTDTSERLVFLSTFSQYLSGANNIILGGAFNFILDPNLEKIGGNLKKGTTGSKTFKTILEKLHLLDCFRYLYPLKRSVTWMGSNVRTRLDRFYID